MYYTDTADVQGSNIPMEWRKTDNKGRQIGFWADGTWWQGHYVAVLATEYRRLILQKDSVEASATLHELRQALKVYERLDLEAENCWGGQPALNGFYLRDDVPADLFSILQLDGITSDYARFCGQEGSTRNAPSQDQAWATYLGLLLTEKLVGDSELNGMSARIAAHMVEAMQYTDVRGKEHWRVVNPVNGMEIQKEGDLRWLRYAHGQAYGILSGRSSVFGKSDKASSRNTWNFIQNHYDFDKDGKFNWYGVLILSAVINEKGRGASSTYEWLYKQTSALARKRPDYGQQILFPHLSLSNYLLYGDSLSSPLPEDIFRDYLDAAPSEGAHRLKTETGYETSPMPWHSLSLFCPWHYATEGEYNMLDYMLLYNLYWLVYA